MNTDQMKVLAGYRLERSAESLKAAEIMLQNRMLTFAMNRIYYSMFYAVQAVLVIDDVNFSKHGQVKGYFNKTFIKTDVFPLEMGRRYNRAFEFRQKFDYLDFAHPKEETVLQFMGYAKDFLSNISSYLEKKIPGVVSGQSE